MCYILPHNTNSKHKIKQSKTHFNRGFLHVKYTFSRQAPISVLIIAKYNCTVQVVRSRGNVSCTGREKDLFCLENSQ